MDPIEDGARFTLMASIFIGAVLDLACIKWRGISNLFIYMECLTRIIASLIPNYGNYERDFIGNIMLFSVIFICFYCDEGRQIIFLSLTLAWHIFFDMTAYKRTLSLANFAFAIFTVSGFFINSTIVGSIVVHISHVHKKLHFSNVENIKLLNGMHEGVLILTKNPD